MSDGELHAYQALLVLSAVVLLGLSALGLGQRVFSRTVEGLLGLTFGGYAAYLLVIQPEQVLILWYAFVAPAVAVVHGLRSRRRAKRRRLFAGLARLSFVEPPPPTPLTPFPPPPPPLGSQPPPAPAEPQHRASHQPMPSGLPSSPAGPSAPAAPEPPRPGMPSGLPRSATPAPDVHQPTPGRLHGVDDEPARRPSRPHAEDRPARRKLHGTEQFDEPAAPAVPPEAEPAGSWGHQPETPGRSRQPAFLRLPSPVRPDDPLDEDDNSGRHRADEPDDRP
jgi:hypothetical protein